MARRYEGFVDTLAQAHATGRPLWVFCRNCGYARTIKPWDLIKRIHEPEGIRLTDLGKRFVCGKCSHHVAVLIPAEGLAHGYRGFGVS